MTTMTEYHGYKIEFFDEINSTNTYLVERAKGGAPDKTVAIANHQTAGRGRRGKSFFSPENTGLYMSIIRKFDCDVQTAMLITPAAACAVADGLERICGRAMGIKWVNDIYSGGKKLCGILTETKFDFERDKLDYAVIGIGINLCKPKGGFPKELENVATAVFSKYSEDKRIEVIQNVLDGLDKYLPQIAARGFLDEYRRRSVLIGRTVNIIKGEESHTAQVLGIDDNAKLVVKDDSGVHALDSGEISIKLSS